MPGVLSADRAVEITVVAHGVEGDSWAYPDFQELREARAPFREVARWKDRDETLSTPNGGEYIHMMSVSANYFQLPGAVPTQGRAFIPSEDEGPGQHAVAVVSHAMWQNRLGGDPSVIGSTVVLNQDPYTVVGVAPEAFTGHRTLTQPTEIWIPLMQDPWVAGADNWTEDRASRWLRVLGSLKEGATLAESNAALATLFHWPRRRGPGVPGGAGVGRPGFPVERRDHPTPPGERRHRSLQVIPRGSYPR